MRQPQGGLGRELLIALVVASGYAAALLVASRLGWSPSSVWGYVLVGVVVLAVIVAGRRLPLAVLCVVGGLLLLLPITGSDSEVVAPLTFVIAPLYLAAFFAIALGEHPRIAIMLFGAVTVIVVVPAFAIARIVIESGGAKSPLDLLLLYDWSEILLRLATGAITSVLGVTVRRQRIALDLLEKRTRELEELRSLETQRVVEQTRTMLAREIHDEVAHHVAALVITSHAGLGVANEHPERLPAIMRDLAQGGKEALGALRRIVRVLQVRAGELDPTRQPGMAAGLDDIASRVARAGLRVEHELEGADALTQPERTALLLIVQEAVTNVLLHSAARSARVTLVSAADGVGLTVVDEGPALERFPDIPHGGTGLVSMRDRARVLGGTVSAGPCGSAGWAVSVHIPHDDRTPS